MVYSVSNKKLSIVKNSENEGGGKSERNRRGVGEEGGQRKIGRPRRTRSRS